MRAVKLLVSFLLILGVIPSLSAQYFGRNKPNYQSFDFEVHQSPNFEIYHYLNNPELLEQLASQSEQWYNLHQHILRDTFGSKNPLLLYNDHPDFQQTNAIGGSIGSGTGGVTEAFKNRVIIPIATTNEQTRHVLGHELVHAFQYDMIIRGDSTSLRNLANLPLWMVEGLAEYMSIGSVDAHTAMWMRDAVLNDDFPSLKKLDNPKYFPYRYGQAFWAFLTGLQGDDVIAPFFVATAKYGLDVACKQVLGMSKENLSELWVSGMKKHYGQYIGDGKERFIGQALINKEKGGSINISPEISPNGRYLIFLSERDLFSIDLFLADARTGEIIRKVASTTKDGHIDDFNFIESSGAWSPDSKQFAFVGVSKGDNILIIKEALTGKTVKETTIKEIPAFSNPAWSPDGKTIVVTGQVNGQTDLFAYEIRSGKVTQLTNTSAAELHPEWSEDGQRLYFSTDQLSIESGASYLAFNLAEMELSSGVVTNFPIFPGADNLNPIEDSAGNLIFLSNRDGFRNIYKYDRSNGKIYQLTDLITGVSGITPYAPAISLAGKRDRLVYSYFSQNGYNIYRAKPEDFLQKEVDPTQVDFGPATMPKINPTVKREVDSQLMSFSQLTELPDSQLVAVPFKPKFKLDYINGSAGVGVGQSPTYGTVSGVAGGIDMLFGDILGNNQIFASLALNGEISDFGGTIAYINRKHRISWGTYLSHIPYRSLRVNSNGLDTLRLDDGTGILAQRLNYNLNRLFEDKIGAFAQFPFTTTTRIEVGGSFSFFNNKVVQYDNYYNSFGQLIYQEREKQKAPPGFQLATVEAALVGDNSYFGLAAPLQGYRYRLGVERYFGEFEFTGITADYRKYLRLKPVTLAFRMMHYGRYGGNSEQLYPLYVGSPWYVRGYNLSATEDILFQNGRSFEEMIGSKILVGNIELRIPFSGPEQLALFKSKFLFTDLNFFLDSGMAWTKNDQLKGDIYQLDGEGNPRIDPRTGEPIVLYNGVKPIFSAGASVRINLFGAMILEPYYAFPLLKETKGVFGLNIIPGW
ncbi:MAG: peptidase S9 [Saprospiraceae bacterium]|nr:MAG: peptidase S9 [Saprospiraceae bacterium]